jgi:hypothetical protein
MSISFVIRFLLVLWDEPSRLHAIEEETVLRERRQHPNCDENVPSFLVYEAHLSPLLLQNLTHNTERG